MVASPTKWVYMGGSWLHQRQGQRPSGEVCKKASLSSEAREFLAEMNDRGLDLQIYFKLD